jgi:nicotinate dehydrogenase subunit A
VSPTTAAPGRSITVNGTVRTVRATPDTPLLYVLRDELGLRGPRFGCGLGQCGACIIHLAGTPARSCTVPLAAVAGRPITTLEGLGPAQGSAAGAGGLHPVQQAFVDEQATQCGYCVNGWIMTAAALLAKTPKPTDAEIRAGLRGLVCRCGAYMRMLRAVRRAAQARG